MNKRSLIEYLSGFLKTKLFLAGIILTFLLISIEIWYIWSDYNTFLNVISVTSEELRLQELSRIITDLQENTGRAVFMFSVTHNRKWKEEYKNCKRDLDVNIKEFIELSESNEELQINKSLKELEKIEEDAFNLISENKILEGQNRLLGVEYIRNKALYIEAIQKSIISTMQNRIDKGKTSFRRKISQDIIMSLISLIILIAAWAAVIIRLKKQLDAYERSEKALLESEERYRAIGELIPFGVWVFSPSGSVIYLSDSFRKLLGMSLEESRKTGWLERVQKEEAEKIYSKWKECVKTNSLWDEVFHIKDVQGQEYAILSRGVPIRDKNGNITSWVGMNLDITAREKMEMELRKSKEDLEKRVEERTLELKSANEKLKEEISVRKKAEEELDKRKKEVEEINMELVGKNDELNEFASMVSQDLREPLRRLISTSNQLEHKLQNSSAEEGASYIKSISSVARGMELFIQDLLTLCKAGKDGLRYELFSLDECVEQALYSLSVRIEETKAQIKRDSLPDVFGDRMLLTHLYQNLIENAINYVDRDFPLIELTVEKIDKGLVLGVKDNGTGIEKDYIETIFKPGKRENAHELFCRTGVGLGIARKAVEQHGGKIWVESEGGKGAHFKFTLG
jgi:PAS domain S-box-containing protein